MVKVNVSLGLTLCTNESSRNFLRLGMDLLEIDTAGNVDAQIGDGITVGVKALHIMDDQLLEEVSDIVTTHRGDAPRLRDEVEATNQRLAHVQEKLIPNIIDKVKELVGRVDGSDAALEVAVKALAGSEGVNALKEGAEVEVKVEKAKSTRGKKSD